MNSDLAPREGLITGGSGNLDPFDLSGEEWGRDTPTPAGIGQYHARDCAHIARTSLGNSVYFPGIVAFVFASIQAPFNSIEDRLADIQENGVTSIWLYGYKRIGLQYVLNNAEDLWNASIACSDGSIGLDDLLMRYLEVPGLGIVKASFLAQLTTGQGACMDGINLHRFDLREDHFRHRSEWTPKTRLAKVRSYNAYWQSIGDSGYWWDTWCQFQAERVVNQAGRTIRPIGTTSDVSALHLACLRFTVARG